MIGVSSRMIRLVPNTALSYTLKEIHAKLEKTPKDRENHASLNPNLPT
jgi:hypothetical protein